VFARRALLIGALVAGMNGPAGATEDENREKPWRLAASVYGYVVPDEPDFVMAIVPVEIGRLHLEGRYNYEAVRSGAAFAGVNAGWGKVLAFHVTPMIGGVVGDVDGLVPALRLTLAWWKLDLYSESEVVIDLHDAGASFFYDWSELGVSPIARLRFGAAAQRSRLPHATRHPARTVRERHDPLSDRDALRVQRRLDDADLGRRRHRQLLTNCF